MLKLDENDKLWSKIVSTSNEKEDRCYTAFHGKLIYGFILRFVRMYVQ